MRGRGIMAATLSLALTACQPASDLDVATISPDDIRVSAADDDDCIDQLTVRTTRAGRADAPIWAIEDRHPDGRNCVRSIRLGQRPPGWRVRVPMGKLEQGSYIVEARAGDDSRAGRFIFR